MLKRNEQVTNTTKVRNNCSYKQQPIGIIGGMGPDASARLYQIMIDMARSEFGVKTNTDYPEIVLQSIPVPEFIAETKEADKAYAMVINRINQLANQELKCVGIACNTAQVFLDRLKKETGVRFISILKGVLKEVELRKYKQVGLLASPATYQLRLYQKQFEGSGIEIIIPSQKEVVKLGKIVEKIVVGQVKDADKELVKIADNLIEKGAEAVILGCTELPLVFPKRYQAPVLDSVEILARSLLKRYYQ